MAFFHGVETVELESGGRTITVVRAGVIGLIGIAPKGAINEPIVVNNDVDAAQFGSQVDGFTIPQAIDAIFKQGAGTIVVVNVFDPSTDTLTNTAEAHTVANGSFQLDNPPIGAVALTGSGGTPPYTQDTDYSVDDFGKVTILDAVAIPDATAVEATYESLDEAAITSAKIIGTVDGNNNRTGLKAFDLCFSLFGFRPKLFIAPKYVENLAIAPELLATAQKLRGFAITDAPVNTTKADAIAGRGPAGTINFNTSSKNAILLWPHLQRINPNTEASETVPYSAYFAGAWAAKISNRDIQWSASNTPLQGITAPNQRVSFDPTDPNTDANDLNAQGIVTVGNYGTGGLRTWGNRSAKFPSAGAGDPETFYSIMLVAYVVDESIEQATLPYIDSPITSAFITFLQSLADDFLRSLIQRGVLIDGTVTFPSDQNTAMTLAAGQLTYEVDFMPPPPAERITYRRFINTEFLQQLVNPE